MELLVSASFIASFFAGIAALFAPCCVTVLLPTYFASVFQQRKTVFLMTFIYFTGLLTIFLPIGLGASFLSQLFGTYHTLIFSLGAGFLLILGLALIGGFQLSLTSPVHPQLKSSGMGSVFVLGVFSGIATICCAPVLAGVIALSVLPGSFLLGGAYSLAYVIGMVTPLFLLAGIVDKTKINDRLFIFRKSVSYKILGRKISVTYSNLFSGLMFLTISLLILFLAATNNLVTHASYQININIFLTNLIKTIEPYTRPLPEIVWAILFFILFLLFTFIALRQLFQNKKP